MNTHLRWWAMAASVIAAVVFFSQIDFSSRPPSDRCATDEADLRDAYYRSQWNFAAGRRNTEEENLRAAAELVRASERLCREAAKNRKRSQQHSDEAMPKLREILTR